MEQNGNQQIIDKTAVGKAFDSYVKGYNIEDPKIELKYTHTKRVAFLSEEIARSIKNSIKNSMELEDNDIDLAWLIGMLHDIGRFEQVRRFGTFNDSVSVDHAEFGADLLFNPKEDDYFFEGQKEALEIIRKNIPDTKLVETAIRNHNKYRVEEGLDDRTLLFANIIRDADKVDILKVNVEFDVEEIYNIPLEELLNSDISQVVLEACLEGHAVNRALRLTPMDLVIGHASMMQELVFEKSKEVVRQQGYLKILLDKPVKLEQTKEKLAIIKKHLSYLIEQ